MNHSASYKTRRLKDIGLYVLISFVVISFPLCALFLDWPWTPFIHWFGFFLFMALLYAQFVIASRNHWHRRSYWALTALLLLINILVFAIFIPTNKQIPVAAWIMEAALLMGLRSLLTRKWGLPDTRS